MESSGSRNSSVILYQILIQLLPWNNSRFIPACKTTVCNHICEIFLWVSVKKHYKKPEEFQESLYNEKGAKGSPRILSKSIFFCPSTHMWKNRLWNNCSLQNISTQKCWNYLSTQKRRVCSCCRSQFWSVKTCVLHPLLFSCTWSGGRRQSHDLSVCFWLFRAQSTDYGLSKKQSCMWRTETPVLDKLFLPDHVTEDCLLLIKVGP